VPAEPGTFERIGLLLGDALAPLAERMHPDRAPETLGLLGVSLPPEVLTPAARSALGAAATAAGQLPPLTTALVQSIEAEADALEIAGNAVLLAEKVGRLLEAAITIADHLGSIPSVPGVSAAELDAFASALPGRLLELLLTDHLERRAPAALAALELIGVIAHERLNAGSRDPAKPEVVVKHLRFDRLGALFTEPEALVEELYGWGTGSFQAGVLLDRVARLLTAVAVPVTRTTLEGTPPRDAIEIFLAMIAGTPTGIAPPGLEAGLTLDLADGFALTIPPAPGLEVNFRVEGSVGAETGVRIQPPADVTVLPPSGSVQGQLSAGLALVPVAPAQEVTLLGVIGGSRLAARRIAGEVQGLFAWDPAAGRATGDFGIGGRVEGGKLVVTMAEADGFIGTIMSGFGLEADFDLGFGWRAGSGVYFTGSGGLEVQVPTHIELGPIELMAITVRIGIDGASFPVDLTADIKAALGPVQAVVQQIGLRATLSFPEGQDGNLGVADLAFSFKPPSGVGLSIDVGVVKGGGFLFIDTERGEYAGALELVIADFLEVAAIGLINTKNPDGSPGFSLLIIISVGFGTGIQLGYGFTLLAVGGLVGINRTMNLQALMEGVRSGSIESVMFPQDIIANAPRIISDLRTFFPAREGTFLVGPMLKIGWGTPTLISLAVGVIIEIPGNIAIVGVLKLALPTADAPLIILQVNFAGALEFDKSRLYFFASLFESRILFMTIDGEMGLLVAWGDDASFVLSVGGFHPTFTPPPLPFPSPRRIVVSIIDTDYARIQVSGYFAITSNTAQFGARAELFFGVSAFSVEGHIAFDALFQFSPFYFIIEISASVSLKAFGVGVFSIRLRLSLEGPSPWRAKGTGSISLLFFEIEADFDITWGEAHDTELEPADVLPLLAAELAKDEAWQALPPAGANLLVSLRGLEDEAGLVLHPVGALQVRQRAVPLDLTIAKVGSRRARDGKRFSLSVTSASVSRRADLDEQFAVAQFVEMDDAAKLSRPAYERQHGGIELAADSTTGGTARMVKRIVRFEEVIIDNRFRRHVRRFRSIGGLLFDHFLDGAAITLSPLSAKTASLMDPFADAMTCPGETFAVASTMTNAPVAAEAVFTSHAAALDHMAALVTEDPNAAAAMHVIPAEEMSVG